CYNLCYNNPRKIFSMGVCIIKIKKKIIKIGNSYGVTIHKDVLELLEIKKGDTVLIKIEKIKK
ncbi:MAG: AbrB/MazE/SpoVT family DNA-binding domain-containing protein, partial [Cetobacterium sp.]